MRRPTKPWLGMMAAAIGLIARPLLVAQQPVHEIQIAASRFQFDPPRFR